VLKAEGVYYFFPATHGMGRSGVPDIICCVSGKFLAIECKAEGGKPTALQLNEIAAIRDSGGVAAIASTNAAEMVRAFIKLIREGIKPTYLEVGKEE
tara:strand:- start:3501 stop:3791 length:291 start_codon:yes stop_codon:yes gene_type:complete